VQELNGHAAASTRDARRRFVCLEPIDDKRNTVDAIAAIIAGKDPAFTLTPKMC